jgi:hypothetical protein
LKQAFARKAGHTVLTIAAIFFASILVLLGLLLLWSPGKPIPFVDESGQPLAGSVSEKVRVNINGVEQRVLCVCAVGSQPHV